MFDNKGQMRTVEVFLSIVLFFSALAVTALVTPGSNLDIDTTLASMGMETLISMDNTGKLGNLLDGKNWSSIADSLKILLPISITYNLTVFDSQMHRVNDVQISNGLVSNQDIVSIQYPCASSSPQGSKYLLRLQLSKVG
jgi:hypothetical protein